MTDRFAIIIWATSLLLLASALMAFYTLILGHPELFVVVISLLTTLLSVYLAQMLREEYAERMFDRIRFAAIESIIEELVRGYCTAGLFGGSLLSTAAWRAATESGIIFRMEEQEFRSLMACYSSIEFYNHDMKRHNLGAGQKQERVKEFIKTALETLDAKVPTKSECCEQILAGWATQENLDGKCREQG